MARAGLSVDRLVGAAAELADAVGFENVTVSALARHFGVKDASLYSHIRNLDDLRQRVALKATTEMADAVTEAIAGRAGKDALVAFAHAYRDYALAHPGRYVALQLRLEPDRLAAHPGAVRGIQATYDVLRAYGLREPDLTDAARLFRSTFHGFIAIESADGFAHPRPTDASWLRILDGLHSLLSNWPGAATQARPSP